MGRIDAAAGKMKAGVPGIASSPGTTTPGMSSLPVTPNISGIPNGSGMPSQPSTADLSKLPRLPDGRFDFAHLLASLSRGDISFNEYAAAFAENKRITDALDQASQNNAKQEADAKFQKVLSVMGIGNAAGNSSSQLANGNGKGYNGNGIASEGAGDKAGIPKVQVDEILKTPKYSRPDPATYLKEEYITSHTTQFKDGVTKISYQAPSGYAGPPGGTFVMPTSVADDLIARAGGDISELERLLGLDPGELGTNPVRIDIANPSGLRMPSGNEKGANFKWIPGGYTSGGIPEVIIDSPGPGQYIVRPIK